MVFLLLFENSIQPISTPGILYPKQQVELITLIDLLKFSSSTAVLNLVQLYHAANSYISKRCIPCIGTGELYCKQLSKVMP